MSPGRLLAASLAVASLAPGCRSTERGGHEPVETFSVIVENDWFAASDDSYTNGIGFAYVSGRTEDSPPGSKQRRWVEWLSFLPLADTERYDTYATWTVGHEMFTPSDITVADPPLDDQPYAGVLFIDVGLYSQGDHGAHSFKVRFGAVGPVSQADDIQKAIHDVIDDDDPQGWGTQLPNEPILNLDYTFSPAWVGDVNSDFSWRALPVTNVSAGSYFTGASATLLGELGWNLNQAVGLASLRRGVDPIAAVGSGRGGEMSFGLFAGFGGFFVAHYLPLDGTIFSESRSVETEPWVGFVTGGARWGWRGFSISYQVTAFTDTFVGQTSASDFGALSFTWAL